MKKKILGFVLAIAVLISGAICFAACDVTGAKCYFTVGDTPEHCYFGITNVQYGTDGNGKNYVDKNQEVTLSVWPDNGYTSSDFKLYVNGEEVETTKSASTTDETLIFGYNYSFTATEEFNVTFTGTFHKVVKSFKMTKASGFDADSENNNQLYIRFNENNGFGFPATEMAYVDFVTNNIGTGKSRTLAYDDTFDFYVYTKGYKGAPTAFWGIDDDGTTDSNGSVLSNSCLSEYYREDDKFGYHYTFKQQYCNSSLTFENSDFHIERSIYTSENGAWGNSKVGSKKLSIELQDDLSTLTIKFDKWNKVPQEAKSALKLKINGELQTVDFTQSDNGVFTVNLKHPYEYTGTEEWQFTPFAYNIDLNFYMLDFYKDEQMQAFVGETTFASNAAGKTFEFRDVGIEKTNGEDVTQEEYENFKTLIDLYFNKHLGQRQTSESSFEYLYDPTRISFGADNTVTVTYNGDDNDATPFEASYKFVYYDEFRDSTLELYTENGSNKTVNFEGDCIGGTLKLRVAIDEEFNWLFTFRVTEAD